jgi:hypothetical protein
MATADDAGPDPGYGDSDPFETFAIEACIGRGIAAWLDSFYSDPELLDPELLTPNSFPGIPLARICARGRSAMSVPTANTAHPRF